MPARVLIADAMPVVREGLKEVLGRSLDMIVVAEARSGLEVERLSQAIVLDLLVLDVDLPDQSGFDLLRLLRNRGCAVSTVLFSGTVSSSHSRQAMRAGAQGLLSKSHDPDALVAALRSVLEGQTLFQHDGGEVDAPLGAPGPFDRLSRRETEVLTALLAGETATSLAERLKVSTKTIATYRERLMEKVGVETFAELAILATRHGLV